jgi:16S rRNA (adenine(1408)-N(1))-methyltransferase
VPARLFVGLDANAAGLRHFSGRADRARLANLLYVRAAIEDLPSELTGVADQITVVLPWGSLLAAVACPSATLLRGIFGLCQRDALLTVVFGVDPVRDRTEIQRLGLPSVTDAHLASRLAEGYADAGFTLTSVRPMSREEVIHMPSTWARRLAHGSERNIIQLEARARS